MAAVMASGGSVSQPSEPMTTMAPRMRLLWWEARRAAMLVAMRVPPKRSVTFRWRVRSPPRGAVTEGGGQAGQGGGEGEGLGAGEGGEGAHQVQVGGDLGAHRPADVAEEDQAAGAVHGACRMSRRGSQPVRRERSTVARRAMRWPRRPAVWRRLRRVGQSETVARSHAPSRMKTMIVEVLERGVGERGHGAGERLRYGERAVGGLRGLGHPRRRRPREPAAVLPQPAAPAVEAKARWRAAAAGAGRGGRAGRRRGSRRRTPPRTPRRRSRSRRGAVPG